MFARALLLPLLAAWHTVAQYGPMPEAATTISALGADDECRTRNVERCSLNALQFRRQATSQSQESQEVEPVETEPAEAGANETGPRGPYQQCGGKGHTGGTECTEGYSCFNVTEYFSMCKPEKDLIFKTYNSSSALDMESDAPLLSFYVYRAVDKNAIPPDNTDAASIGGIMWYLHNEIASCTTCPVVRPKGIDRVARYKVLTRATRPLHSAGMNFGLTLAFEIGQCTDSQDCDDLFAKYGYFVGCNNLSAGFPHPNYPVFYTGALYSLPGRCTAHKSNDKSLECKREQPGGLCKGVPTGNGTCTWSYTDAGVVSLDELEGIENYTLFKEEGGEEYNATQDKGVQMTFWDDHFDVEANAARVKKLDALFKEKYPDMPSEKELPSPPCDFSKADFFSESSAAK